MGSGGGTGIPDGGGAGGAGGVLSTFFVLISFIRCTNFTVLVKILIQGVIY